MLAGTLAAKASFSVMDEFVSAASVAYAFCNEWGSCLGCTLKILVKTDYINFYLLLHVQIQISIETKFQRLWKLVSKAADQVCQEKQAYSLVNREFHTAYKYILKGFTRAETPWCHVTSPRDECPSFPLGQEETEVLLMQQRFQ